MSRTQRRITSYFQSGDDAWDPFSTTVHPTTNRRRRRRNKRKVPMQPGQLTIPQTFERYSKRNDMKWLNKLRHVERILEQRGVSPSNTLGRMFPNYAHDEIQVARELFSSGDTVDQVLKQVDDFLLLNSSQDANIMPTTINDHDVEQWMKAITPISPKTAAPPSSTPSTPNASLDLPTPEYDGDLSFNHVVPDTQTDPIITFLDQ